MNAAKAAGYPCTRGIGAGTPVGKALIHIPKSGFAQVSSAISCAQKIPHKETRETFLPVRSINI